VFEARELFVGLLQELFDPLLFGDLGAMDSGFEHETFGIYQ